jgi:MFS family permease
LSLGVIRETFSSRNVMVLTITQTLFMFTAFLWWPYRSLFILELGATKELVGMLQMIETVTQLVCQLPGGILADRFGRRKLIVYGSIFRVASPIIYILSTSWTHVAPGLFIGSFAMLGLPAMNALMAESLPIVSRGAGLSAYRAVTWMPMIITGLLGGVIMDTYGVVQGVKLCVSATLIVSIFSVILRWRFLTETLDRTRNKEDEGKKEASNKDGVLQQLRTLPREIWILTMVAALSGFAIRLVMSFMVVYAVEVVGLTNTQWGLIGTAVSLISTVLTIPGGVLADRIGRKPCITVSRILSPISTLGFTFSANRRDGLGADGWTRMAGAGGRCYTT